MRYYLLNLNVPATASNGTAEPCSYLDNSKVVVFQVTSGEFKVQVSVDGSNWVDYEGPVNASQLVAIPFFAHSIRVVCLVDGTATAQLAGYQSPA